MNGIKVIKKADILTNKQRADRYIYDHERGLLHLLVPRHTKLVKEILLRLDETSCKKEKKCINFQLES
jgi:hypothetical protein